MNVPTFPRVPWLAAYVLAWMVLVVALLLSDTWWVFALAAAPSLVMAMFTAPEPRERGCPE